MTDPLPRRKIVIVESPWQNGLEPHPEYARAALRDCFSRGEVPLASHLLYTQPGVLRDDVPEDRQQGMEAGWELFRVADLVAVYFDLGVTSGMEEGIRRAIGEGQHVEYRRLVTGDWRNKAIYLRGMRLLKPENDT